MIGLGANGRLQIETQGDDGLHCFSMKAMVRVLGLAMSAEVGTSDREMLVVYCDLLEAMLPSEGQLQLEALAKSSPKGRTCQRAAPNESM